MPVLRGKPAADLCAHAKTIFSGQSRSDKTVFMHDQFCIGEAKEEGCYEPPSDADLRVIANWLGSCQVPPDCKGAYERVQGVRAATA